MTPTEIALVQDSFRKIVPIAEQAAALFYARLFELDPSLRAAFRGDMPEQGRKLMSMLATAVAALGRFETLVPAIRALGVRHRSYGAAEAHYASVGSALLWTLEKGLGGDFTPAVCDAWTKTYTLLATTMIDAQRNARAAA
jgi:hemoglobin-like flavoprotein